MALLAETGEPPDQVSPANQDRYVVTQARKLLTDRSGGKILSKVAWADAAAEAVGPQAGLLEEIEITSDLEAGLRFGPAVPPAEVEALDCVLFDAACLEHPAIVPPGWRREVDSSAPALSDVPGCQRRVESDKVRPLFEKEEEYARAAASSWIAHPAVRGALNAVRPNAVAVTALLLPHMVDQIQCMRFCWRICGIGPVYPDGSEEPNPFDPGGPAPWPLTEREREQAGYIAAVFHLLVLTVAAELCDAGVPLDPEWGGDQAVLAVLLLLPALGYEIPWDGKIDEFAAMIQPPGISAFTRDGRSTSARDGRPDAMARNADRIRKHIRAENGGRKLHVPYAQGTGAGAAAHHRDSPRSPS